MGFSLLSFFCCGSLFVVRIFLRLFHVIFGRSQPEVSVTNRRGEHRLWREMNLRPGHITVAKAQDLLTYDAHYGPGQQKGQEP